MDRRHQKKGLFGVVAGVMVVALAMALVIAVFARVQLQSVRADYERLKRSSDEKIAELEVQQRELEEQLQEKTEELKVCEAQKAAAQEQQQEQVQQEVYMTADEFRQLPAGEVIADDRINADDLSAYFLSSEIVQGDAVYNRIIGNSYRENDNIGLGNLRYLQMIHYNFDHQIQAGELIVNADVADDVRNIFRELFMIGYEVNSMYLIDNFWTGDGDTSDNASIQVNNTSAFCYRVVTGGTTLSSHAYGRAIDINPQQNPYVSYDSEGNPWWYHDNATPYVDRSCGDPHVIVAGDACYEIFTKYGFSWGGNWSNPKDYQHFEKP